MTSQREQGPESEAPYQGSRLADAVLSASATTAVSQRSLRGLPRALALLVRVPLIWAALAAAVVAVICLLQAPVPLSPFAPVARNSIDGWFARREDNAFRRWAQLGGDVSALALNHDTLLVAADTGSYRSDSDGRFWAPVDPGFRLNALSMVGNRVWAVGAGNVVRHSSDGGVSWQSQTLPPLPQAIGDDAQQTYPSSTTAPAPALPEPAKSEPAKSEPSKAEPGKADSSKTDPYAPAQKSLPAKKVVDVPEQRRALNNADPGNSAASRAATPSALSRPAQPSLLAVQFVDANTGWIAASHGTIAQTRDGGASWSWQLLDTAVAPLASSNATLQFIDSTNGWLLYETGALFRTRDGGASWQAQTVGVEQSLQAMHFVDANNGWIGGSGGALLSTRDGGESWQPQQLESSDSITDLYFFSASSGWLVTSGGGIYHSSDGGKQWREQQRYAEQWLNQIRFRDADNGWAVGADGLVLISRDGGVSWQRQTGGALDLGRQHWRTAEVGWLAGSDGVLLTTDNGGEIWQLRESGTTNQLISVFALDEKRLWAAGAKGTVLHSGDGGLSWQAQATGIDTDLTAIRFFDANNGVVIGDGGVILLSRDGGVTWQPRGDGHGGLLVSLNFLDARRGWLGGDEGALLYTADGGENWLSSSIQMDVILFGIQFVDSNTGWLVGDNGLLMHSRDAGKTWQRQDLSTNQSLYDIQMRDANQGWAVGAEGTVLHTADGGARWQLRSTGNAENLHSVHFSDSRTGWVAGAHSTILFSRDGGDSWQAPAYVTRWPLSAYVFAALALALLLLHVARHANSKSTAGVEHRSRLLEPGSNDNTVRHYRDDKLDTGKIARSLSWFLQNRSTQAPLTLAVTGAWGSGKSSVMRMMQSDLSAAGYSTVWFNAWHQNSEDTMLAALVETLRQQGIPPWHSLSGFWFGCKLISRRLLWPTLYFAIALLVLGLLLQVGYAGGVSRFGDDWQKGWQHADEQELRRTREKQALTLDSRFFQTFEWTPVLLQVHRERRFDSPKAFEDFLIKELGPLPTAATDPESEHRNQFLRAFHQHYFPAALPDNSQLITRIANRLHEIWEDMQGLLLGGGAAGATLLALLTLKNSLSALGNANGWRLFRHRIQPLAVEADPGLRYRIQRALEELARACGERRLVIFIDDVDRCPPKQQRKVLEIANTLHAASDGLSGRGFFIVLGAALDVVVPAVASDMQDEVAECVPHEAGVSDAEYRERLRVARTERARLYLEKIVNMEVHIAATSDDHLGGLFGASQAPTPAPAAGFWDWLAGKRQAIDRWTLPVLMLLLVLAGIGWMIGSWQLNTTSLDKTAQAAPAATVNAAANRAADPGPNPVQPPTLSTERPSGGLVQPADSTRAPSFTAPALDSNIDGMQVLLLLLVLLTAVVATALTVLKKLEVKDRADFIDALRIWSPVIGIRERTPRHVKRASNQLRYFSMRVRQQMADDEAADALCVLLVVVRALRDLSATAIDDAGQRKFWRSLTEGAGLLHRERLRSQLLDVQFDESVGYSHVTQVLEQARAEHIQRFGQPDAERWQQAVEAFKALSEGIVLR